MTNHESYYMLYITNLTNKLTKRLTTTTCIGLHPDLGKFNLNMLLLYPLF